MEKVTVVQGKTQVVIDRSCLPAYLNAGWQLQEKEDTKKGAKLSVRPMIGVILNACRMSVGPMHGSMVVKHATP